MENNKAIPHGYMTVGELAKKMNTTVRTLHHYDKTGLLSPSCESEGGFRLYSYKDMVKLYQILSMRHLGFSLDDIKNRLPSLDTPADVTRVLTEHASAIRTKMENMAESLNAIEALKDEVEQMQTVDFNKYAIIIGSLQMKNEYYWVVKHFDNDLMDYFHTHFDKERAEVLIKTLTRLNNEASQLKNDGVLPESEKGQAFAKSYWDTILDATDGDMELIVKLAQIAMEGDFQEKLALAGQYTLSALEHYFSGTNDEYLNNITPKGGINDMEVNK